MTKIADLLYSKIFSSEYSNPFLMPVDGWVPDRLTDTTAGHVEEELSEDHIWYRLPTLPSEGLSKIPEGGHWVIIFHVPPMRGMVSK